MRNKWVMLAHEGATLIGMWIVCYHAAGALLMWMPASWGGFDENGQWRSHAWYTKSLFACVATLVVVATVEKFTATAAKRVVERQVLNEILEALSEPVQPGETASDLQGRLIARCRFAVRNEAPSFPGISNVENDAHGYGDGPGVRDYRIRLGSQIRDVRN
jgi:hypothetical protein